MPVAWHSLCAWLLSPGLCGSTLAWRPSRKQSRWDLRFVLMWGSGKWGTAGREVAARPPWLALFSGRWEERHAPTAVIDGEAEGAPQKARVFGRLCTGAPSAWAKRAGCHQEGTVLMCWTAPHATAATGWLLDTSHWQLCLCLFFHVKSISVLGCWLLPLLPVIPASAVCPLISQELSLPLSFHPLEYSPNPFSSLVLGSGWNAGNITLVTLLTSQAPEPFKDTSAFLLMMSFVLLCKYKEGNSPAFLRMSGTVFTQPARKICHPASFMQTPDSLEHITYYHGVISQA